MNVLYQCFIAVVLLLVYLLVKWEVTLDAVNQLPVDVAEC